MTQMENQIREQELNGTKSANQSFNFTNLPIVTSLTSQVRDII